MVIVYVLSSLTDVDTGNQPAFLMTQPLLNYKKSIFLKIDLLSLNIL